ncbi:unnamed protein product [Rhodiola kirilowii]
MHIVNNIQRFLGEPMHKMTVKTTLRFISQNRQSVRLRSPSTSIRSQSPPKEFVSPPLIRHRRLRRHPSNPSHPTPPLASDSSFGIRLSVASVASDSLSISIASILTCIGTS